MPSREHPPIHTPALLPFFLLVCLLSAPLWLLGAAPAGTLPIALPFNLPISALVAFCPALAALILVHRDQDGDGAKRLLQRAVDYRRITNALWYLPAIFLMPQLMVLEYGVMKLAGIPVPDAQFSLSVLPFFALFFLSAIGEELGWQGYAIEPLLARWNALSAALILGAAWALWHGISFVQTGHSASWVFWQSATTVGLRVLIVWLYSNTGRSIFAAVLFHAMTNVSEFSFPIAGSHYDPFIATMLIALTVAIVIFLWGPKTLARFRFA